MRSIAIVIVTTVFCIAYPIMHDQITERVCVEYFTIGNAPIFGTDDPTLLGVGWGILATWWMSVLLRVPLAFAAQCGSKSRRETCPTSRADRRFRPR